MDWIYWRPVRHGLARGLYEVKKEWSIVDLVQAHQVLDTEADIEAFASKSRNSK